MFSVELSALSSVAVATLDLAGVIIDANPRFLKLVNMTLPGQARVDYLFIQPDFSTLLQIFPDSNGVIYQGLLTLGERTGVTRTLNACIWREDQQLRVLAEFDIESLEHLSDTILKLNQDYARAQFEIIQINLKLKQRESELERSLVELEATNLRLKTTQKQLVEAEKMASLSMMVAGVAHEINTPLGVSLGSASLLEHQSQRLAQNFEKRSMTHAELEIFLNKTLQETQLIRSNLDRIAKMTDSFRQLAVSENGSTRSRFRIKNCLDDVIVSLEKHLLMNHVTVNVFCDESLEIDSYPIDWASIFINLITNSIQHGFKGRNQGCIEIRVSRDEQRLLLDYTDDGAGLSLEAQKHIFDPFFTTDLQHGMGLGMHFIYNLIAHKFHGTISCDNPSLRGAHFQIKIPL